MAGDTGRKRQPPSITIGVRRRVVICLLAALLGLTNLSSLTNREFLSGSGQSSGLTSSDVTINGTRYRLGCRGHGESTVVIVNGWAIGAMLDVPVRSELARYVHLCTLSISPQWNQSGTLDPADVLPGLLIGARVPVPVVIISEASASPVLNWSSGPPALEVAGFVLIQPSSPPSGLLVQADGSNRPLPMDDRDRLVLAILSLFWPPDEV